MDKVVIFGAGRHAELVGYEMDFYNLHEVVAYTVQSVFLDKEKLNGLPVVPYETLTETYPPETYKMFVAVGPQAVNGVRENLYKDSKEKGYSFVNCICPSPTISENIKIGENVYIDVVSMFSRFVEIGNNVVVISSQVGHYCKIGDNCFISGSILAGNITIENNVFIGLGSAVGPNITLGEKTVVGMGCSISKNTDPASVYINQSTLKQKFDSSKLKLL